MDSMLRIPEGAEWPKAALDTIRAGDALETLRSLPSSTVALAVTSPPYWDVVNYGMDEGEIGQTDYDTYLRQLLEVWKETERVLIPNGKLAIVTPIMPIPKKVIGKQHTRHLKNISADIESTILSELPGLNRLSLFVWQKQTTVKMFGSYPYPPNIYEDNTIEFISVFVKEGEPPRLDRDSKEASKLTQAEWLNLTMQVWPLYPEDVVRAGGHPAPFPVVLPLRLIKMYTFARSDHTGFAGDIVLDMFNGTGASCIAAKLSGRHYIGIDLNPEFCSTARNRLELESFDPNVFMLEKARVRKARNSRQLSFADTEESGPALIAEDAADYVVTEE